MRVNDDDRLLDGLEPIPIADPKAGFWREGASWNAWGFPVGHPAGLMLDGGIVTCHGWVAPGIPAIQLRSEQKPYADLLNASGAAVIANGVAIGLIRKFTPNMAEGAVFASPLGEAAGRLPELTPWLLAGRKRMILAEIERQRREGQGATREVRHTTVTAGDGGIAIGGDAGNITIHNK